MSDYSLFRLEPVHVRGKGEVVPKGYVSESQRDLMEAAQMGQGSAVCNSGGRGDVAPSTPQDPWGDLR